MTDAPPPLFTTFHENKVSLWLQHWIPPKVTYEFHLNQTIYLPVFFPKPHTFNWETVLHTVDVRRALSFYLGRTKPFHKSSRLSLSIADRSKSSAISIQRLSKRISECIIACYQMVNVPSPVSISAHSTRSQSISVALLKNDPILEICRAATWSLIHTSSRH